MSFGLMSIDFRFLVPNAVFVRGRVGEWMISAYVVSSVKHGGGVMVWRCFAGDTVWDLFRIQAHLTGMATTAFCSDLPSHLVCT